MNDAPTYFTENASAHDVLQTSEIRYRRLFESARDGILILDAVTRKITDANPYMVEILGYSHDQFIGRELWEIGLLNDEVASTAAFTHLQETGYIRYEDLPLKTRDGKIREVEFVSNVYWENERQVVQCNIRDITEHKLERKRMEGKLHDSEQRYRQLVEMSPDAIVVYSEGKIVFLNSAGVGLLGASNPSEIVGRPVTDFIHQRYHELGRECIKQGKIGQFAPLGELKYFRLDGTEVDVEVSGTSFIYNGKPAVQAVARNITKRKKAEEELTENRRFLQTLIKNLPGYSYRVKNNQNFPEFISEGVAKITGYGVNEYLVDRTISCGEEIIPEDQDRVRREIQEAVSKKMPYELTYRLMSKTGEEKWVWERGQGIWNDAGELEALEGFVTDITQRKRAEEALRESEEQLRQSQKLESVGRLAGGIAHDFNNMLTAINGYSDLTLRRLKPDDPLRSNIEEIKKAGERSAVLTHQLLAFSRQQILQPKIIDLNEVIGETINMLQRLIGEDIQLTTLLHPRLGYVQADPGQLSQVIMNLAVNARDAMPQGGKLTIETANVNIDYDFAKRHIPTQPGAFVMLAVSDTGIGMDEATQEHIFEPFFTTKEVGVGTGLGLATVYGIVKQSGGYIQVKSALGTGSTFRVCLPCSGEESTAVEEGQESKDFHRGTETILLVEDEDMVRNLSRQILEDCGYTVIEARHGSEALEVCENGECRFDLLMTDVVMPQMGGRELAEKLAERLPDLRVLFTSGYTDDEIVRYGVIETGVNFLQKPFTPDALAQKVRKIFDNHE